jgi:hypothetical protein
MKELVSYCNLVRERRRNLENKTFKKIAWALYLVIPLTTVLYISHFIFQNMEPREFLWKARIWLVIYYLLVTVVVLILDRIFYKKM